MSNNRKLVFKNNSSNKKQTISVPTIDTSLLADRERLVCLFDKIVTEEKVLLGVNTLIYNENNTFEINYDILIGDKERFILVKYIREDDSIQSTEEAFRETQQGSSKAQQYSNIKINSTGNQFFNTNKIIKANNIINSVCTDGLYIDTVTNYEILLKQTMYNKTILNYLDDFLVYYKPTDNVTKENIEVFNNLFIPNVSNYPYQLKSNFYGVDNNFASNKFWVLPVQFKNEGITYDWKVYRGSTFEGLGMNEQPTNEKFENIIAEKLSRFRPKDPIFVEAESANIGKCKIPHEFYNQMKVSKRIEIIRSESNRLNELIQTYSIFSKEELKEAVFRIKKRLGPQRTKLATLSIEQKKWDVVCKAVLEYYDKCYEYEKVGKENIKTLDLTDMSYDSEMIYLINNIL